ncbi:MAG: hypothetical protein FJW36_03275 [Acidobacteria bacterium]|nr:hypothetical protein [Acidobacteriota bacterium]
MKKTFNVDADLLKKARQACGADTDTDTLRLGLESLIRRNAYEQLRKFRGSQLMKSAPPRRHEAPVRKRKAA